jgi:hypothetical protein
MEDTAAKPTYLTAMDNAAEPDYLAVMDDAAEPDYLAVIDDTAEPGYYSEINDNDMEDTAAPVYIAAKNGAANNPQYHASVEDTHESTHTDVSKVFLTFI